MKPHRRVVRAVRSTELTPADPTATISASCAYPDHALTGGFESKHAIVDTSAPGPHAWYVQAHLEATAVGSASM